MLGIASAVKPTSILSDSFHLFVLYAVLVLLFHGDKVT